MSTNFPTSLDSYSTLVDGTHYPKAEYHNNRGDAIEALEAKVGVDSSTVTTSFENMFDKLLLGFKNRARFAYKDADEICIYPASYDHRGTTNQILYWDSTLTFKFGSGGSNEGSTNLAASDWFYVYLDDSAIVTAATNVITNSEIVAVTTEPAWSASKHGWYNGSDRCIFAVLTDSDSHVLDFQQDGDFVQYDVQVTDLDAIDIDDTWTDETLTLPKFASEALCTFIGTTTIPAVTGYWRKNGSSGTGHDVYHLPILFDLNLVSYTGQFRVSCDSSQKIEVKHSSSNSCVMTIHTDGYFLPTGI